MWLFEVLVASTNGPAAYRRPSRTDGDVDLRDRHPFGKIVKTIPIVVKKAEKRPPRKRPGATVKPAAKA